VRALVELALFPVALGTKTHQTVTSPKPGPVKCLTPLLADLERLKHLRDLLAEVQAPGYRRQEPEAAKGWLNRLLG
jgi:hypothetical protein